MKTSKFTALALLAAGVVSTTLPAKAAQGSPLVIFGQSIQKLDTRGGNKNGAAGYVKVQPGADLSNVRPNPQPTQLAQSSDATYRVDQLEEEMRSLNGKVEDMTFQLLQLQEQIRKMQEDNEFRFQELEDRSDAGSSSNNKVAKTGDESLGKPQPSDSGSTIESGGNQDSNTITEILNDTTNNDGDGGQQLGEPPVALGTLTFDENGNLVDSNVGKPIDLTGNNNIQVAGLPDSPNELFNLGYQYVQAGEYERSEEAFSKFVSDFGSNARAPEARFWLGESLFSQGNYESAAKVFLANHKDNPKAVLAPQNLLKLGVSLAGLDQRELACATYAEVPKKYPDISSSIRKRVEAEQRAAKCKNR